jgi:hypothetical protein
MLKENIDIWAPSSENPCSNYYTGIEPFKGDVYITWKIERLKKDEMWLSCTYNNADYYLKFEVK